MKTIFGYKEVVSSTYDTIFFYCGRSFVYSMKGVKKGLQNIQLWIKTVSFQSNEIFKQHITSSILHSVLLLYSSSGEVCVDATISSLKILSSSSCLKNNFHDELSLNVSCLTIKYDEFYIVYADPLCKKISVEISTFIFKFIGKFK
ncbi:hypothetical protein BW716_25830 [[Flexibacter] sp. ATCC 35208]|nr:hypothetical protein BW716_25830 [[Flexibacter] sp. ATCC 35208]